MKPDAGGRRRRALLLWGLAPALARAAECPPAARLGPGLCDANGDLLADPPTDPRQWLNPDPLVMADVPTSDMTARAARAEPFRLHLEQALGRRVTYFIARDYADLIAAFRAQRVHLLNVHTGSVEQEVQCAGYVPIAQPIDADGELSGYRMEIVVPADSPLRRVEDLRGRTLTLVDERSASGYKLPRALLEREFGMRAQREYQVNFSGRHDNSIMGVANGLYEAAAVASAVRADLLRQKLLDPDSLRILYASPLMPHSPWGVSHRLHPELVEHLRKALVAYRGPEHVLQSGSRFRVAQYRRDWGFMRELNRSVGDSPSCRQ